MTSGCVFCQILGGEVPAPEGYRRDSLVAHFIPLNPVIPGHRVFIPREHVIDASSSPFWTGIVFMAAADYARERRNPFNLITSAGLEATQTVWHFGVHYLPRIARDGLMLPWSGQPSEGKVH